jgi:hypothetical protein
MHILLFILYFAVLSWILTRRPFFRYIRPPMLIAFFALRVATGCLHNWIAFKYYPNHGDIWLFFNDSFDQRYLLFNDLHAFWINNGNGSLSSLSYLQHNIIEWTNLFFNYLSFDNFYINTLLFCFFTLGGHFALFRVFYERYGHDTLSAACMLFLPSILFWTSCIDSEGFIYPMLGWIFYTMHRSFKTSWTWSRIVRVILLTALVILFRPAVALGLLPALALWTAAEKQISRRTLMVTSATFILLIAVLSWLKPGILQSVPRMLSARQHEYQALTGNSRIALPLLEPDWTGLVSIFPEALFNGLFQPLPGAGGQKVYLFFSLELLTIWIIMIIALTTTFIRKTSSISFPRTARSWQFAAIFFALSGMLLIGYIVPFVGAIVRYRSIYLPFLLAPCLTTLRSYPILQRSNNLLTALILK